MLGKQFQVVDRGLYMLCIHVVSIGSNSDTVQIQIQIQIQMPIQLGSISQN